MRIELEQQEKDWKKMTEEKSKRMTDKCKNCPDRDWCWYEEEEDFCDKADD